MGVYGGEEQSSGITSYRDQPMDIADDDICYENMWTDDEDDNESIS